MNMTANDSQSPTTFPVAPQLYGAAAYNQLICSLPGFSPNTLHQNPYMLAMAAQLSNLPTGGTASPAQHTPAQKPSQVSSYSLGGGGTQSYGSVVSMGSMVPLGMATEVSLDDIHGKVVGLSKQQAGSRSVQKLLLSCDTEEKRVTVLTAILSEVFPHLEDLMHDAYGNYMMQAVFKMCDLQQLREVVMHIKESGVDAVALAVDVKGTHALQTLVGCMVGKGDQGAEDELVDLFIGNIVVITKDSVGAHVIQHVVEQCSQENALKISAEAVHDFPNMVLTGHGICVAKKIMARLNPGSSDFFIVLNFLIEEAVALAQHSYGNFAVQFAIQEWPENLTLPLMNMFRGWLLQLSTQKFGSNVAETLLEYSVGDLRNSFFAELLDEGRLTHIMKSSYGIFVAQKAISVGGEEFFNSFCELITRHLDVIPTGRLHKRWCALISEEGRLIATGAVSTNTRMKEIQHNLGSRRGPLTEEEKQEREMRRAAEAASQQYQLVAAAQQRAYGYAPSIAAYQQQVAAMYSNMASYSS